MQVRCLLIHKIPDTSMHTTALLNTLWKFTREVEEGKDRFIQKALKLKLKPLKTPNLDVPVKKAA